MDKKKSEEKVPVEPTVEETVAKEVPVEPTLTVEGPVAIIDGADTR